MIEETEVHEMTRYREGRVTVWYCPTCGREVTVIDGLGTLIVERGNQAVEHRGNVGLIPDNAPEPEPDNPVADWLEEAEIDIAALLDSDD